MLDKVLIIHYIKIKQNNQNIIINQNIQCEV